MPWRGGEGELEGEEDIDRVVVMEEVEEGEGVGG